MLCLYRYTGYALVRRCQQALSYKIEMLTQQQIVYVVAEIIVF